jgi:hypothetical protein
MAETIICSILSLACLSAAPATDAVDTVDGRRVTGSIVSMDAGALRIKKDGGDPAGIRPGDISSISLARGESAPNIKKYPELVVTYAGDSVPARDIMLDKDVLSFSNPLLGSISVPAERIVTIVFPPPGRDGPSIIEECARRGYKHGSRDRLVVLRPDGKVQSIEGLLRKVGADKISFNFSGRDRTISRSSVMVVLMARLAAPKKPVVCEILGAGDTRFKAESVRIAEKKVTAVSPAFGDLDLDRATVSTITFKSDRVVMLSDLKPVEAEEYGFFDVTFSHRLNRSVGGGPLKMAGRTYTAGVGMHSYSRLAWDIGGKYSTFLATVGIDDSVRPHGNANLTILADGKEILKPVKLTGVDKPVKVRMDVKGAKKLTLLVDFGGDGLGVADHVDIVEARLVK